MEDTIAPVAFAIFAWWFGTGLVFLLARATRGSRAGAIAAIMAIGALSLFATVRASLIGNAAGAYLGFTGSISLWGALELSFLSGLVIGPRREACAPDCRGARHFGHAIRALLYHELALAVTAAAVVALTWRASNLTGTWTFLLLWAMRESAKLNLFLGVRNPGVELLPEKLAHLRCYFARRAINGLFPLSIAVALLVDLLLVRHATASATAHETRISELLLATLLALGLLEHVALVLPLPSDALWRWAVRRETGLSKMDACELPHP